MRVRCKGTMTLDNRDEMRDHAPYMKTNEHALVRSWRGP